MVLCFNVCKHALELWDSRTHRNTQEHKEQREVKQAQIIDRSENLRRYFRVY